MPGFGPKCRRSGGRWQGLTRAGDSCIEWPARRAAWPGSHAVRCGSMCRSGGEGRRRNRHEKLPSGHFCQNGPGCAQAAKCPFEVPGSHPGVWRPSSARLGLLGPFLPHPPDAGGNWGRRSRKAEASAGRLCFPGYPVAGRPPIAIYLCRTAPGRRATRPAGSLPLADGSRESSWLLVASPGRVASPRAIARLAAALDRERSRAQRGRGSFPHVWKIWPGGTPAPGTTSTVVRRGNSSLPTPPPCRVAGKRATRPPDAHPAADGFWHLGARSRGQRALGALRGRRGLLLPFVGHQAHSP
jgi:hypothetical protein